MEKFNLSTPCPKCGNHLPLTSEYNAIDDTIIRKCVQCSYEFKQLPWDRKEGT